MFWFSWACDEIPKEKSKEVIPSFEVLTITFDPLIEDAKPFGILLKGFMKAFESFVCSNIVELPRGEQIYE